MKKAFIIFSIFITFFILYFLQQNFFSWFTIAGIKPNLFIILILFVGIFIGRLHGVVIGIVCGALLDLFIGRKIGLTAILLGSVGFIGTYLDNNFSKDSKITMLFMVLGITIIYEIVNYIFNVVMLGMEVEIGAFIKILVIELIYQFLLTIILYPFMRKVGYYIENIFKDRSILTRYF